uniref:Integrin subunit alpha X n=1 Tax=Capra hircus TaxID=9925 RepID=A0A452DSH4_CAPHI
MEKVGDPSSKLISSPSFPAPVSSLCFNLDMEQPTTFRVDSPGFGHSVVQYAQWLVVGAPQEVKAANQTGGLYWCDYSMGRCEAIPLQVPPEAVNMSLGLSLAATTDPFQLLACGPTVHHACRENMHLTGICFLLASPFQQVKRIPAALQECPRQDQDIAFLIDGSGSISSRDFNKMLSFVKAVMSQFQRPSSQFSLVQFSDRFQEHFTFKDFATSSDPLNLLNSVWQLRGWTFTASAIRFVTQGPLGGTENSLQELIDIASTPSKEHVFQVENFDALRDIQKQLKEKIFAIEGTQTISSSSFELEMSQEGFSGVGAPFSPLIFSWSGGAFLYPPNKNPTFINMSQEHVDMRDSYLGYSTELALWKGVQSLILGAPRHQHTGKVVLFTQVSGQWRLKAEVTGTQTGSYFGASLCSVDVNGDSSSDLVLIGAPHFYEQTHGGQVSVCPFPQGVSSDETWCDAVLRGEPGHPWGRFGAALTVLGDVNGDRLADVAIGAPGEQENRGAVYLFHGTSELGISPSHSQLSPSLQYFGQSLSGGQDLTQDGLADLAVGAQGHALLLRTRPVLRMWANIHITPTEIARSVYECEPLATFPHDLGKATVCLHVSQSPKNQLVNLQSIVTFDLTLDPGRLSPRAIFQETRTRNLTRVQELGLKQHCEAVRVHFLLPPDCVEDSVTPIILRLNFSLVGKPISSLRNLQPMLAVDAQRYFTTSLPFEKNCGADHVCQDDLSISFGVSDLKTLMVGSNLELNLKVRVWNDGEDSYGTAVTFFYPPGLSYRRVTGGQVLSPLGKERLMAGGQQRLLCWVQCSGRSSSITFTVTFHVSPTATLGDKLLLVANVSSENNSPKTSKTTFQLELPVKYAVYTVISSHEQSTKYLNFSASQEEGSREAQHRYQVNNLGQRELPVSIDISVPMELNQVAVWKDIEVLNPQVLRSQVCNSKSRKVLVVSVAEITFNRLVYSQLPGQETFLRAQTELVLEKYEVYNPIPLVVGSSVGGLLLLALITALLYKVGFFKRQYREMMEGANKQTVPENETGDPQVAQ